jgi:hypothetical protein
MSAVARRRFWAGSLLLLLAACDGDVSAEQPEDQPRPAAEFRSAHVRTILEAAEQTVQTRGFSSDGDEWRGFLVEQGSAADEAQLRADTCYVVVAAGSEALGELDLRVYDSDGTEVARDTQNGPGAALHYCPPHAGTHYTAALATAGTGLFAVRRYAGPTGLDIRLDDLFREPVVTPEGTAPTPVRERP